MTNFHAKKRHYKGSDPDGGNCRNQGYPQESESDADGQRIDAGGDGEDQHFLEMNGGTAGFGFGVEGLFDHVAADEGQENEGDPVVVGGDGLLEAGAKEIAEDRHQSLEGAEVEGDDGGVFFVEVFQG